MKERIKMIEGEIQNELSTKRHFVKKDGVWQILFHEKSGDEWIELKDDVVVGVLTLAEAVVASQDIDVDYDGFWRGVQNDPSFAPLLMRMQNDPFLRISLYAAVEQLFDVPAIEAVYNGIRSEIYDQDYESDSVSEPADLTDTAAERSSRHSRRIVGGVIVGFIALTAACTQLIEDDTVQPLAPLVTPLSEPLNDHSTIGTVPDTTLVIDTTIPSETTPITNAHETVSSTNAPSTVETIPTIALPTTPIDDTTSIPETSPSTQPTVVIDNDSNVVGEACTTLGGTNENFSPQLRTVWGRLLDYNFSDQQIGWLKNNTSLFNDFRINHVMGEGYTECMPTRDTVLKYLANYHG